MSSQMLAEYDATLDKKHRFVLRGLPAFDHFHVTIYKERKGAGDTYILKMEPRVMASLDQLSAKTLRMMDSSMKNFAKGKAGEPLDIKKMKELADALSD